jgi:hypothetical protein
VRLKAGREDSVWKGGWGDDEDADIRLACRRAAAYMTC